MQTYQRLECRWCRAQNPGDATTCQLCGAPLTGALPVSDSGWREAPRLRDMTEIHFSQSTCQVEGGVVPVAEVTLGGQDAIFFEHHTLLWKDAHVPVGVMRLQGGVKRALAGMPFIVSVAQAAPGQPGRIAFSRDATGELVVLPIAPGTELDVREHAFLLCSHTVQYSFVRIKGLASVLHGGQGMFMDRFVAGQGEGLLILHGYGNVFERTLEPGQTILVEPGGFLYKDSSVTLEAERQQLSSGLFGGQGMYMARLTGPGRVGIQSMYVHHATEG